MKWLSCRPLAWTAALLLLAPAASRADFNTNWSFSWNFNPIPPNAAGFIPADTGAATQGTATGGAQFAAASGTTGASTIPVATVTTTSSATTLPDSFQGTAFSFGLTITDNATNASGTLTFDGALHGNLSSTSSSAFATFSLDPSSPSSLVLNGHTYQVSINGELGQGSGLPAPNAGTKLLDATVTIDAGPPPNPGGGGSGGGNGGGGTGGGGGPGGGNGSPGGVQSAPEPSAFALAGIALAALGLAGWWQRQRGRAAPLAA
jgi:hypothetical protein